jgi:hypothetical protein
MNAPLCIKLCKLYYCELLLKSIVFIRCKYNIMGALAKIYGTPAYCLRVWILNCIIIRGASPEL